MRKFLMWLLRDNIREMINDRIDIEKQVLISQYNVGDAFDKFFKEKFMSFDMGVISYLDGLGSDVQSDIRRIAINEVEKELLEFNKEEFLDKVIERINRKQIKQQ